MAEMRLGHFWKQSGMRAGPEKGRGEEGGGSKKMDVQIGGKKREEEARQKEVEQEERERYCSNMRIGVGEK